MIKYLLPFTIICFCTLFISCGPTEKPKEYKKPPMSQHQLDSLIIAAEQAYNKMEEDNINAYIRSHNYKDMQRTNSGFWYMLKQKNDKGRTIKDGDLVRYAREISLCNGTMCYSDTNLLKVSQGQEITGMHDALKLLKQEEKAIFIFPSYLAHGLMGDSYKIPPKSELVYEVSILEVR